MKRIYVICALLGILVSGCDAWNVQPLPYLSPTPFSSPTPIISSPTPIILPLPVTATAQVMPASPTNTSVPDTSTPTSTATQTMTETMTIAPATSVPLTLTATFTSTPSISINAQILGCNTSIDITHGMGEVTNAYVTIANNGSGNLANVCATLSSADEGRAHPDKTKCVASLPAGYQVSEKLTIDTTLEEPSPIQVDVTLSGNLLQRLAQNSCTNVDLIPPHMSNLGTVTPIATP